MKGVIFMKKIIAILLALTVSLVCTVPAFAVETLEDKDKVVEITIDNPFGNPFIIDFGFNKYYDETSDPSEYLPAIEVNGFTTEDFFFWLYDELCDIADYTAHIMLNTICGTEVKTDEENGVTVTYDKMRFGDRTDDITLRVNKLDEHFPGNDYPCFMIYHANDDNAVKYHYSVELLNADGTLADADEGMEFHQMRITFDLPEDAPKGLYEVHHNFVGSNSGSYDFTFNTNGQVSYILNEWVEW